MDEHDLSVTDPVHPTVVVGAGLTGVAAAVALARRGVAVTLVDTRPVEDGCPQVLVRAFTNLLDLYERLGVGDRVGWQPAVHFAREDGGVAAVDSLVADDLPAPMHLVRSLGRFGGLSVAEKLAVARGLLAIMQVSRRGRGLFAEVSFARFLEEHGQRGSVVDRFWSVLVEGLWLRRLEEVPAAEGIALVQEGLLFRGEACGLGLSAVSLDDLRGPVERLVAGAGGRVVAGGGGGALVFDGSRVTAVRLGDGQEIAGRSVIAAVGPDRLAELVPAGLRAADGRLALLDEPVVGTVVGVDLFVRGGQGDGRCMALPHALLSGGVVRSVLNRGVVVDGEQAGCGHLAAVLAPGEGVGEDDELVAAAMADCRRMIPDCGDAVLVAGRVVRSRRVRWAVAPAMGGEVANLMLAGEQVARSWPDSPEGAVRSGYAAAAAVLAAAGAGREEPMAEDLEPGLLYQFVGG